MAIKKHKHEFVSYQEGKVIKCHICNKTSYPDKTKYEKTVGGCFGKKKYSPVFNGRVLKNERKKS